MRQPSLVLALLCACGASAPAMAGPSTIRIRVVGGVHPGSWQVRETRSLCSAGMARPGEWMVRYAVPGAEPRALGMVELIVPEVRDTADASPQLGVSVGFGSLAGPSAHYDVETRIASRKRRGSGSVRVTDSGTTATIVFDARTAEGVDLHGVIHCGSIERAPTP